MSVFRTLSRIQFHSFVLVLLSAGFSGCERFTFWEKEPLSAVVSSEAEYVPADDCDAAVTQFQKEFAGKEGFQALRNHYVKISDCADASYANRTTMTVVVQLEARWSELQKLADLFHADPKIEAFVKVNFGCLASSTEKEMASILEKAKTACPAPSLQGLCGKIAGWAARSLRDAEAEE